MPRSTGRNRSTQAWYGKSTPFVYTPKFKYIGIRYEQYVEIIGLKFMSQEWILYKIN